MIQKVQLMLLVPSALAFTLLASCAPIEPTDQQARPDIEVVVFLWEMHYGSGGCPETAGLDSPNRMRVELRKGDGIKYWRNSPNPSTWQVGGYQVPLLTEIIRGTNRDFEVHICGWDAPANYVFPVIADISEAANREHVRLKVKWEYRTGPFLGTVTGEGGDG